MTSIEKELLKALKECVGVLGSQEMKGVWGFLYVHNYKWTGDVVNLDNMRNLIERAEGIANAN